MPDIENTLGETQRLIETVEHTSSIPPSKAATLAAVLRQVRDSLDNALKLLETETSQAPMSQSGLVQPDGFIPAGMPVSLSSVSYPGDRTVEGVFDGEHMVGADGKTYPVPPNYASKSKLVEGDLLKLTIGGRGNFIFKQVGPIERQRLVGSLAFDQESGQHLVLSGGRSWRVLKASVSYYHGEVSDEVVILISKNAPSRWAAVENILKRNPARASELFHSNTFDR